MKLTDVHATNAATETAGEDCEAYQPPKVVDLGKATGMIRGYWATGWKDYSDPNWYITGQ